LVGRLIAKASAETPDIDVVEVDVAMHPAIAVKYGVMTTPAIAINGKLEFTGVPREEQLSARLRGAAAASRGPS
jgi:protein-disulfide isomerase